VTTAMLLFLLFCPFLMNVYDVNLINIVILLNRGSSCLSFLIGHNGVHDFIPIIFGVLCVRSMGNPLIASFFIVTWRRLYGVTFIACLGWSGLCLVVFWI
jgi:hypothetical protein